MDWKSEIGNIIAQTERNLGTRRTGPLYKAPRMADAAAAAFNAPLGSYTRSSVHSRAATSAPVRPAAAAAYSYAADSGEGEEASFSAPSGQWPAAETRLASQQVLESVRFELEMRGSVNAKQLEALREELAHGLQETERRSMDLANEIEAVVKGAMEAERQLRTGSEGTLHRLENALHTTRKEVLNLIGEGQGTALEHSEVLRRVEQELAGFKVRAIFIYLIYIYVYIHTYINKLIFIYLFTCICIYK